MSVTIVINQPGWLVMTAPGVWVFVPAQAWSDGTLFSDGTGWSDAD